MNDQEIAEQFIKNCKTGELKGADKALSEKYLGYEQEVIKLRQLEARTIQQIQKLNRQLVDIQVQIREEIGKSAGVLESVVALSNMVAPAEPKKGNGVSKKRRRK